MRAHHFILMALLWLPVARGQSESTLPPLPVWSPSDRDELMEGNIIPGKEFFTEQEAPNAESILPKPEEIDPGPEPVIDPTKIPAHFLDRYFVESISVEGGADYLSDPQELLSRQEFRDRQSFLDYHSEESKIPMFVYLFDAEQAVPNQFDIEKIYNKLFSSMGPVALVFYHLSKPERSQLLLSGEIRAVVSGEEQKRALKAAVQEAYEKSDEAYQLDNFLVELSIRLYWVEREMARDTSTVSASSTPHVAEILAPVTKDDRFRKLLGRVGLWCLIMAGVAAIGWIGFIVTDRRIRHRFPEIDNGSLLGAPHAAGVGAVVSFSNAHLPPSKQRDEVPDYLQRM